MNKLVIPLAALPLCLVAAEMKIAVFDVNHCEIVPGVFDVAKACEGAIKGANYDFAVVQDVNWSTERTGRCDQPAEIGKLTGMSSTFGKAYDFQDGQWGAAILSRETPLWKDEFSIPVPGKDPRVLFTLEFNDCYVSTFWRKGLSDDEFAAVKKVAITRITAFAEKKPVFVAENDCIFVDAAHRSRFEIEATPGQAVVRMTDPELQNPVLVPTPVELKLGAGVVSLQLAEITTNEMQIAVDKSMRPEGYRLEVAADGIRVASADASGAFYALQTLKQLAVMRWGRLYLPICTVSDYPRFAWRSVHVDESRHFFGKATMKRVIDDIAYHKFNRLHWHLTDVHGWRVPVRGYEKIMTVGARRPYSRNHKFIMDHHEDGIYGPFCYTEAEIVEVVEYARDRHVKIVPELDFPGHCGALLNAYPEFACVPVNGVKPTGWSEDYVVCLGNEKFWDFFKAAFDQICRLFPDTEIHLGGDEVPFVNWENCVHCRRKMRELGLATGADYQVWMSQCFTDYATMIGRKVMFWENLAIDYRKYPASATLMMTVATDEKIRQAVESGHRIIMCPHASTYFCYDQGLRHDPQVNPWYSVSLPLKNAYEYDPYEMIPQNCRHLVRGGGCFTWSEFIVNERELQWMLWPRGCATAEVLWTPVEKLDYADFRKRMEVHRNRLLDRHVFCAPFAD
ncbi:MAG: family 20 glycosylhydrolase [Kiritimatiellae bacterium]|nr:family 20 glycosylhydrolase [Kiritimatiellia bacterium]